MSTTLGENDIAKHCETCRHPTGIGIGEHRDESAHFVEAGQGADVFAICISRGRLHHACPARSGDDDQRQILLEHALRSPG